MKKLLLLLTFLSFNSYAQYSNYYVNQNVDLDVTGRVNINKTIKNIDYGALAQANAQYERNRLEREKYESAEDKRIALEIAEDPSKAYDYSKTKNLYSAYNNRQRKELGMPSRYSVHQRRLNTGDNSIYNYNGIWSNLNSDFITVELINLRVESTDYYNKTYGDEMNIDSNDPENHVTYKLEAVKEYDSSDSRSDIWGGDKAFIHKVEVNRAKVRGFNGFKGTIIYETKYEKGIIDNYHSISNGNILSRWRVITKGNSKDVNFEQLEGRRYYLRL